VSTAPDSPPKKRPFFLLLALVVSFMLGTSGWVSGCATIAYYNAGDPSALKTGAIPEKNAAERPRYEAAVDQWVIASDAGKRHAFPLGVAAFVLGAAALALAARGLAGRQGGRSALVQVLSVQAVLAFVTFGATREIRWAERERDVAGQLLAMPPFASPDERLVHERGVRALYTLIGPAAMGMRTLMTLFVVLALTRPSARELLEPAGAEE